MDGVGSVRKCRLGTYPGTLSFYGFERIVKIPLVFDSGQVVSPVPAIGGRDGNGQKDAEAGKSLCHIPSDDDENHGRIARPKHAQIPARFWRRFTPFGIFGVQT